MFTHLIRPTSWSKGCAAMNAAYVIATFAAMPQRGLVPLDHLIGRIHRCARIVRREVSP
jgi:hypothetical protein